MLKVERIKNNDYKVIGEGIDVQVWYLDKWNNKVSGKGARKHKEQIINAIQKFLTDEHDNRVKQAEQEAEQFRQSLSNIDLFGLYNVTVKENTWEYGLMTYNKLMTGYELTQERSAVNAEKVQINNIDFYVFGRNDSHLKRKALTDDRLLIVLNMVFVTGLTLKELLNDGLKTYGELRKATAGEIQWIYDVINGELRTKILGVKENHQQKAQMTERIKKEIERATNSPEQVEQKEIVGYSADNKPIRRAWFASKPCNVKEVKEKRCASYERYIIEKSITVDEDTFRLFEETLDMELLKVEFKGGTRSDVDVSNDDFYKLTEYEQSLIINNSYRVTLEVKCENVDYSILIDPQGYNYPRYVAIIQYNNKTNKQVKETNNNVIDFKSKLEQRKKEQEKKEYEQKFFNYLINEIIPNLTSSEISELQALKNDINAFMNKLQQLDLIIKLRKNIK